MNGYIADLMQIVETMPLDERVQDFIVAMRPREDPSAPIPDAEATAAAAVEVTKSVAAAVSSNGKVPNGTPAMAANGVSPAKRSTAGRASSSGGSVGGDDERDEFYDSVSDAQLQQQQQRPPPYARGDVGDGDGEEEDDEDDERQGEDDEDDDDDDDQDGNDGSRLGTSFATSSSRNASMTSTGRGGHVVHASTPKVRSLLGGGPSATQADLGAGAGDRLQRLEKQVANVQTSLNEALAAMQRTQRQLDELARQQGGQGAGVGSGQGGRKPRGGIFSV